MVAADRLDGSVDSSRHASNAIDVIKLPKGAGDKGSRICRGTTMNKWLLSAAVLAALGATSAYAANTAIILWNSADPAGAESATGTGSAQVATSNLDGITITLSTVNRTTSPNQLTEGNILIKNTDATAQTLDIIAGANGYTPGASAFKLTGTIGVTTGVADLAGSFFVDGADTLNGTATSVVGVGLNSFDSGSLTGPFSFSKNLTGFDTVGAPYGMAERLELTLQPGASIFVQGESMTASAIPEPKTWVMAIAGFALLGFAGFKSRKNRLAV